MGSNGIDCPVDLEALQAQIDLSMALTDKLVSSWLPGSSANGGNDKRTRMLEAEMEDILRRPPRLGVGAPLPEISTISKEAHQLRSKINGGKKRRAEEDGDTKGAEQASDEEEGRGKAGQLISSTKRPRLDPFSGPQGKQRVAKSVAEDRKGLNEDGLGTKPKENSAPPPSSLAPSSRSATIASMSSIDNAQNQKPKHELKGGEQLNITRIHTDASQNTKSSKKKRKKKNADSDFNELTSNVIVSNVNSDDVCEGMTASSSVDKGDQTGHGDNDIREDSTLGKTVTSEPEWSGFEKPDESTENCSKSQSDELEPVPGTPSLQDPSGHVDSAFAESTKKKKRRKKKIKAQCVLQNVVSSKS